MVMAPSRRSRVRPRPDFTEADRQTRKLCEKVNEAGFTAEIVRGKVVVSPWTNSIHCDVVDTLCEMLFPLKIDKRWRLHQTMGVHIPPFRDVRLPDILVVPRDPGYYDHMLVHGYATLLAVEVCSHGTWEVDYQEKSADYARAGVPLYLIVDPTTDPYAVTLMSEPVKNLELDDERKPYQTVVTVEAGEPLALPEPFGLTLDTAAIFNGGSAPTR